MTETSSTYPINYNFETTSKASGLNFKYATPKEKLKIFIENLTKIFEEKLDITSLRILRTFDPCLFDLILNYNDGNDSDGYRKNHYMELNELPKYETIMRSPSVQQEIVELTETNFEYVTSKMILNVSLFRSAILKNFLLEITKVKAKDSIFYKLGYSLGFDCEEWKEFIILISLAFLALLIIGTLMS